MSSDPVNQILTRLDKVKSTGKDQWKAICPSHMGKSQTLAIKRADNGSVLIKCWAGCPSLAIVDALGLKLSDLFERDDNYTKKTYKRQYPNFKTTMEAISESLALIMIASSRINKKEYINDTDMKALNNAAGRIRAALDAANV